MCASELSFEDLIAPVTTAEFAAEYWERRCLHVKRRDPEHYGRIFSLADVDRFIFTALQGEDRVVTLVPPPHSQKKARKEPVRNFSMDQLYAAFHAGETVRLDAVEKLWPPLAVTIAAVEEALDASINVNFYMTPASSQGFGIHFDTHDAFIVQVDGSKEWYVYEPDIDLPVETPVYLRGLQGNPAADPVEDGARLICKVQLGKGDLLYIPRGFPHKAVALAAPSLHLTLGIRPVYWLDLLKTALDCAARDEVALRRSLPPGFLGKAGNRRQLGERFAEVLRSACGAASFDAALEALDQQRTAECGYPPDGHFAQLIRLEEIAIDDEVRRRAGMRCMVRCNGGAASIHFAANQVQGPLTILPALQFVRDQQRFRIGTLPGDLSDKSKLVLVRRLIREGLLTCGS